MARVSDEDVRDCCEDHTERDPATGRGSIIPNLARDLRDERAAHEETKRELRQANIWLEASRRQCADVKRRVRQWSYDGVPDWESARSPEELAEWFKHQGYADGDSGTIGRNVSYAEADMIRTALLNGARLAKAEALLREADGVLDVDNLTMQDFARRIRAYLAEGESNEAK